MVVLEVYSKIYLIGRIEVADMKRYVKLTTSLKDRLLFLFTGIIAKDNVKIVKPGKRYPGERYTHYPILPDPQAPPLTEGNMRGNAKKRTTKPKTPPPPPKPPPVRVIKEGVSISKEEKMPNIPFFDLDVDEVKSNL